jgi:hypothetical protein
MCVGGERSGKERRGEVRGGEVRGGEERGGGRVGCSVEQHSILSTVICTDLIRTVLSSHVRYTRSNHVALLYSSKIQ